MTKEKNSKITICGGALSVTNKQPEQQKAAQAKATRKPPAPLGATSYEDRCKGSIVRSIKRTKCAFVKSVQSIKNRPTVHLSIIMPQRLKNPKMEALLLHACLDEFFAKVTVKYPKAYFVRMFGWTAESGFHAHVLMRFGKGGSAKKKKAFLKATWAGIVGSDNPKLLHTEKYYHPGTLGYLTSPDKLDEMAAAIHGLGGKRLWGVTNRKNITLYEPINFELTPGEYVAFIAILEDLLREASAPVSTFRQLEKNDFCCAYLTYELLMEAYGHILKWRESA